VSQPFLCAVFAHDYSFEASGSELIWRCTRGCGAEGRRTYSSAAQAAQLAAAFNRRDTDDLGKRAPLIGLLPLRLWRRIRKQ